MAYVWRAPLEPFTSSLKCQWSPWHTFANYVPRASLKSFTSSLKCQWPPSSRCIYKSHQYPKKHCYKHHFGIDILEGSTGALQTCLVTLMVSRGFLWCIISNDILFCKFLCQHRFTEFRHGSECKIEAPQSNNCSLQNGLSLSISKQFCCKGETLKKIATLEKERLQIQSVTIRTDEKWLSYLLWLEFFLNTFSSLDVK